MIFIFKCVNLYFIYLNVYNVYVVLNMFFLLFQIRKKRKVKPINHGAKILELRRPHDNAEWFWGPLKASGLHDLVYTGYATVPHALLMTLYERWHAEISSFHLPVGGDDRYFG